MPRLARFPLTLEHKAKISQAKTGVAVPKARKDAIAKALQGRKKSPETVAKMKAAQQARRAHERDDRAVLAACKTTAQARNKAEKVERDAQQLADIHAAVQLGRMDLALDIQQSRGWKAGRKIFDKRVSDGREAPDKGRITSREKRRRARQTLWG